MKGTKKLLVLAAIIITVSMLAGASSFAAMGENTMTHMVIWGPGRTQADIDTHGLDPDSLGFHAQIAFYMEEEIPASDGEDEDGDPFTWFETVKDYVIFDGYSFDDRPFMDGGYHGYHAGVGHMYILMAGEFEVNDPMTIEFLPGFGDSANVGVYEAPEVAQAAFVKISEGDHDEAPATEAPADETNDTGDATTPGDAGFLAYAILAGASFIAVKKTRK